MRLTYSRGSLGRRDPASPGAGSSEPNVCLSNTCRSVFPRADDIRKMSPGRESKYNTLEEKVGPKRKLLSLGKIKKKEKRKKRDWKGREGGGEGDPVLGRPGRLARGLSATVPLPRPHPS